MIKESIAKYIKNGDSEELARVKAERDHLSATLDQVRALADGYTGRLDTLRPLSEQFQGWYEGALTYAAMAQEDLRVIFHLFDAANSAGQGE